MKDLINRHDAIDQLHQSINLLDAERRLEDMPAAERKGHWYVLDECANEGVYCSECHKKVFKIDYSNTMKWKNFNFCPACGADMRGEEK